MTAHDDWLGAAATPAPVRRPGGRKRTNGTGDRSRKLECPSCGFIARTSAGGLNSAGFPTCGCGTRLELGNMRDRAQLDYDAFAAEVAQLRPADQNRIWRELGYLDMVVRLDGNGRLASAPRLTGAQKRCAWGGGYCTKFSTGRYCPEHDNSSDRTYGERGA